MVVNCARRPERGPHPSWYATQDPDGGVVKLPRYVLSDDGKSYEYKGDL
jgi:hypothetical protein